MARTAHQIAHLLNLYESQHRIPLEYNIWHDLINTLDEYDADATDDADPSYSSDLVVLRSGAAIRWNPISRDWEVTWLPEDDEEPKQEPENIQAEGEDGSHADPL